MSDDYDMTMQDLRNLAELTARREQWHYDMMRALAPHFAANGAPLPLDRIQIGIGYTSSGRRKNSASIGECLWLDVNKPSVRNEITIRLDQEGDDEVSGTLVHELCHAALRDPKIGHNLPWRELMLRFGIQVEAKKGTICKGSHENSESFIQWIRKVREENNIGPYPHRGFKFSYEEEKKKEKPKQQPFVRLRCSACGQRATMSEKWAEYGVVRCGNEECDDQGEPMDVVAKGGG